MSHKLLYECPTCKTRNGSGESNCVKCGHWMHSTAFPPKTIKRKSVIAIIFKIIGISFASIVGLFIVLVIIVVATDKGEKDLTTSSTYSASTPSPFTSPTPTLSPEDKKNLDDKLKAEDEAKVLAEKQANEKADADTKKVLADKKKKIDAIAINLKSKTDEVTDITWYQAKTSPIYANINGLFLMFAKEKNGLVSSLALSIQYTGDDWVLIDKYIFKVDDQTFEITPNYGEVKRDNGLGGVWEYYNAFVTGETLKLLKAVAGSKKTILRHQGDQHQYDRIITASEKKAIKDVLDAYTVMDGSDSKLNS
jgi:hypothetical protein